NLIAGNQALAIAQCVRSFIFHHGARICPTNSSLQERNTDVAVRTIPAIRISLARMIRGAMSSRGSSGVRAFRCRWASSPSVSRSSSACSWAPPQAITDGTVIFGGQPTQEGFAEAAKRGVKVVINLRQPEEMANLGFDEKTA